MIRDFSPEERLERLQDEEYHLEWMVGRFEELPEDVESSLDDLHDEISDLLDEMTVRDTKRMRHA